MSDLEDARTALADFLNALNDDDIRAVTIVPKTYTPPICWVAPGSPYRQRAQAVGRKRIRLTVVCLGGASTNDETEARTESMAEKVADAIDGSTRFLLDPLAEMDQPRLYPAAQQGQSNLGIAVNVICESTRG